MAPRVCISTRLAPRHSGRALGIVQDMKHNARLLIRSLIVVVGLLAVYCLSFFYFVRSHESTGLRGTYGQMLTMTVVAVPDTKMNRFVATFYAPMFKCLFVGHPIEWEKP
jgi:hypothetical protein